MTKISRQLPDLRERTVWMLDENRSNNSVWGRLHVPFFRSHFVKEALAFLME
jgi:hypothetical protein